MASENYVWFDGKFVKRAAAKVNVLVHSMQYGSGVFEGVRAYKARNGTAIFRLEDHVKRFFNSAKIYSMPLKLSQEELAKAIIETVRKNGSKDCYIRPFAFYTSTSLGVANVGETSVIIATVDMGKYFKQEGLKCKVASWRRINSSILPPEAKGSGNYLNSLLASLEAKKAGADEAILLTFDGYVAEGPGENIFLVEDNTLVTPSKEADILMGITRDSIIKIAESTGMRVEERQVHQEELETCDEAFFAGTAAEITPITEINGAKVGNGKTGPMTNMLIKAYDDVVRGNSEEFEDWLVYV
ncbi:MAG: branched-chain amino acid transaminase [Candidatus Micrarchaeia archaeon]